MSMMTFEQKRAFAVLAVAVAVIFALAAYGWWAGVWEWGEVPKP
jgi:hypothetical protein